MDTIKRCFAYSPNGTRCDHPAGHPGDHAITYTWTDEECFSPTVRAIPKVAAPEAPAPVMEQIAVAAPAACIACQHRHKGGECKCGCYEHIG